MTENSEECWQDHLKSKSILFIYFCILIGFSLLLGSQLKSFDKNPSDEIQKILKSARKSLIAAQEDLLDQSGYPKNTNIYDAIGDIRKLVDEMDELNRQDDDKLIQIMRKALCQLYQLLRKTSSGNYWLEELGEGINWSIIISHLESVRDKIYTIYKNQYPDDATGMWELETQL
jgi:hypothetical protein